MAELLQDEIMSITPEDIVTGPHIMDIVSSGMYNDPMMVLREFIQNSTDSIDQAIISGNLSINEAEIAIQINGRARTITVHDNGNGVPNNKVKRTLCSIAASEKTKGMGRGFRGIGRLGALGYCDELMFRTKAKGDPKIAEVVWDAKTLRSHLELNQESDVSDILSKSIRIGYENTNERENCFFEVTMIGVKHFHDDTLMHIPSIKSYLSLNAPVPFNPDFLFRDKIEQHIQSMSCYKTYRVMINGKQIFKPHTNSYRINSKRDEHIKDINKFVFYDKTRQIEIAKGWYAVTNFESSIPKSVLMRGIIVRQGNILIGGDSFLADYFSEKRFSTWCVGEIHVSNRVKVNARRDGFEHTEDMEALTEQFGLLGGHLSKLFRTTSMIRSRKNTEDQLGRRIECFSNQPVVIDEKHKNELINLIRKSNHLNPDEIIKKITLFEDLYNRKRLVTLDAEEIVKKIVEIFKDDKFTALQSSELITRFADALFVDY